MSNENKSEYRANFLWPHTEDSLEEAGFEFANGRSENYQKYWWKLLIDRARAPLLEKMRDLRAANKRLGRYFKEHP